ncbi:MAG: hypothetical protein AB1553_14940 [Nitrospirota bacterium]
MIRFEEVQMKIAEAAKNHLEIINMQVFMEQFTLDRESRFSLTLPHMEPPYPLSATISFIYDAFQTGITLYEDESEEAALDIDTSLELDFIIKLPHMERHPALEELLEEIEEEFPDTQPMLLTREVFPSDGPSKEYEISYSYTISAEDVEEGDLFSEIFEELKGILELVDERTKDYIDHSWYRSEE